MKNINKSFALLCMGFAAVACVEENFEDNTPKYDTTPGNEIVFSATAGIENGMPEPETKTVYGDQGTDKNGKKWIEINWDGDKDMIQIVSPEAAGPEVGHYRVGSNTPSEGFSQTHQSASVTKLGDGALQWSESDDYTFYGVYPSFAYDTDTKHGATATLTREGVFTGSMPIDQNYTLEGNANAGWIAKPDMRYAFMTASDTYKRGPAEGEADDRTEAEKAINLEFKSMVTALQFQICPNVINIPVTGADDITSLQIISVSLLSNKGITGEFEYNIAAEENPYKSILGTRMASIHFDETSLILNSEGGPLDLTFFILPEQFDTNAGDYLRLQIIFKLGATQMSRIATIKAGGIEGGKKYLFKNVKLEKFEGEVPPSSWWDTLDPDTILPQISIPVASNVFANASYGVAEKNQQQQLPVDQLWQMGVRGFEICTQAGTASEDNTIANFNTKMQASLATQKFQVAEEAITPDDKDAPQNFGDAFEKLYDLLNQEGAENECLILLCTYMSQSDGYSPLIYVSNLFNYLTTFCSEKNITDYSTRFKQITSDVTVGDLRGKIAIVIRPGNDERWRSQYGDKIFTDPYKTLFDEAQTPDKSNPIPLTAQIKNKLSSSPWWDYVLLVEDWGAASFDRWDRRYGDDYASAATFNIRNVSAGTESTKLYIEDYLYGVSSSNGQTLGSANGTYTWAGGTTNNFNGRFNETNTTSFPIPQTFDFEHSMSNGSKAYVQEWMRVVKERTRIPVAYKTNNGRQTLWVDWPSSIGEKKTAIKDLFNKSVLTQGQTLTDLYINVLTGYYIDYKTSRPGTFPFKDPMDGFTSNTGGFIIQPNNGDVTGHGKGGNFKALSADLNSYVYDLLSAEPGSADGLSQVGPWGLVMLDNIQVDGVSDKLVELIMMNNFKFDMAVKPNAGGEGTNPEGGSTGTASVKDYNSVYMDGENAISFE